MLKDLFGAVGNIIGTVAGIAVAPIAVTLGVAEHLVRQAILAGCRTEKEIKEWIENNT